jgi:hypothetical protein
MVVQKNKNIEGRRQLSNPPWWKAPPDGVYKINWDAAIHKTRRLINVGIIVRDNMGIVFFFFFFF